MIELITATDRINEAQRFAELLMLAMEGMDGEDAGAIGTGVYAILTRLNEAARILDGLREKRRLGKCTASPLPDLEALIAAHLAALAGYDALTDHEWEDPARRQPLEATVDATRLAVLDHRPTSLQEVSRKAKFMAGTRSFHAWDDFDRVLLVHALTPADDGEGAPCAS